MENNIDELRYAISLKLTKGLGSINIKKLVAYCGGNFSSVYNSNKRKLHNIPNFGNKLFENINQNKEEIFNKADELISDINNLDLDYIFYTEKNYPKKLKDIIDNPIVLYKKGNTDFSVNRPYISIVGTRNITNYGKDFIKNLIFDLKKINPIIVSGLAYGVDIHVHKECIKNNIENIAVLAHGLDMIYPTEHSHTVKSIIENGSIISEFEPKTIPDKQNFPIRNRVIAGLSDVTIVIESALKGGSIITANLANDYNREVFAVPGNINSVYSKGCNKLIKENKAFLLESADDIFNIMNWQNNKNEIIEKLEINYNNMDYNENKIIGILEGSNDGIHFDDLLSKSNMKNSELITILFDLQLKGYIKPIAGNKYKI